MISQLASEQPVRFKYTYIFDKCYHIAYLQNYNLRASSNLLFLSSSILDVFRRARSFSLRNGYVLALSRAIIIPHRQEYDVTSAGQAISARLLYIGEDYERISKEFGLLG